MLSRDFAWLSSCRNVSSLQGLCPGLCSHTAALSCDCTRAPALQGQAPGTFPNQRLGRANGALCSPGHLLAYCGPVQEGGELLSVTVLHTGNWHTQHSFATSFLLCSCSRRWNCHRETLDVNFQGNPSGAEQLNIWIQRGKVFLPR